jgi:undecaprenyl-diphosphatase
MIWQFLSIFGDIQFWIGAAIVSVLFLFTIPKKARKHVAWFVFLVLPAVIISSTITLGLKDVLRIPRPCLGDQTCPVSYSLPSGHATVIFAAMTALSLHYKKKKLTFLFMVFAFLVTISRLMLGVHTLDDVVIGSIIGLITGILVEKTYENYQKEISQIVKEIKV